MESLDSIPSLPSEIELSYLGGAAQRVASDETAFGDRSAPFIVNILSNWSEPAHDETNIGSTRQLFAWLRPAMVPGVYVTTSSPGGTMQADIQWSS